MKNFSFKELLGIKSYKEEKENTGDSLNDWHNEKGPENSSFNLEDFNGEGEIVNGLTPDEQKVVEQEPSWFSTEDVTSDGFIDGVFSADRQQPAVDDFHGDFEDRDMFAEITNEAKKRAPQIKRKQRLEDKIATVKAEIAKIAKKKEAAQEKAKHRADFREAVEGAPTYSPGDMMLMEEAGKFQLLLDNEPKIKDARPKYPDGKMLTDEEIEEQRAKFRAAYQIPAEREKYSKKEWDLMRTCLEWDFLYRQVTKNKEFPVGTDGEVLTGEAIAELAGEYNAFRKNRPIEFADMKVEAGEWFKNYFEWKETDNKGKKEYICRKAKSVDDKKGDRKKVTIKYITDALPDGEQEGSFYFSINENKSWMNHEGTYGTTYIDIKDINQKSKSQVKAK